MIGSARALLVDAGTVALVVVLLVEGALAVRVLAGDRLSRIGWSALGATVLGLVLVVIARGADLVDVITLDSADRYPTIGVPYLLVFLVVVVGALAVTDSVMARAGWVEGRVWDAAPRARRLWAALVVVGVGVALVGLEKVEPAPTVVVDAVPAATTTTTTTTVPPAVEFVILEGRSRTGATGIAEGLDLDPPAPLRLVPLTEAALVAWPTAALPVPGTDSLYVATRDGLVVVVGPEGSVSAPILDMTAVVDPAGDIGFLGLALHPEFASNGRLFVGYRAVSAEDLVVEYRIVGDPTDPSRVEEVRTILRSPHESVIHQGGVIRFGPDGLMYLTIGDAGLTVVAQDPANLRGSIVRFDVDSDDITFPITSGAGPGAPEVWVSGVRNPYTFWIDAETGLGHIGDVGELTAEEIDIVPLDGSGYNLGWPVLEGFACRSWAEPVLGYGGCDRTGFMEPALAYGHNPACAVLLGPVYRGAALPEWDGWGFFADYCTHILRAYRYEDGAVVDVRTWAADDAGRAVLGSLLGFGLDGDGEPLLFTADRIWRLAPAA